jgi:MFS family permease
MTFFLRIISYQQVALGEIISFGIGTLFELPSGVLADLIGRRRTITIGYIIGGIGYSLMAGANNFESYLFGTIVSGIGNSFISGAEEAFIYDTLKEREELSLYSKIKAREALIYRSSLILSTIIGGYIYELKEFLPYLLTGIFLILAGVLYAFAKEPNIDSEEYSMKSYTKNIKSGFIESFKNTKTSLYSFYYILVFTAAFLLTWYFEMPYLKSIGFNEKQIGWIFAAIIFLNMFVSQLAPKIEKSSSVSLRNFLLPLIPGIILLLAFENKLGGLLLIGIENAFLSQRFVFTQKAYNENINSHYRASALSTMSMFCNLLYILFVFCFTGLFDLSDVASTLRLIGLMLIGASMLAIVINIKNTKNHNLSLQ